MAYDAAWAVWNDRNKEFHENERRLPQQTADFIFAFPSEFRHCQQVALVKLKPAAVTVWKAPKQGIIKVNFDGSFKSSSRVGSFGAIARDYGA
ncbi:hypothetical protein COLO4_28645 [Corchorus olitorius]|uniref:RNase H type-1 domain-containing protein n=1 Tax=Corchorus olitorius TaxID=93759 RepID=A0A1R3HIY3_9ROSI|nr:hypothetical protein COLO4_28645 [Corchorus olitorius]